MKRFKSSISTNSQDFKQNYEFNKSITNKLSEELTKAKLGGPEHHRKRHQERGKLLVRDRIEKLIDKNTPFLEFSALAANDMYDNEAPSAGVVTGIGVIHGQECVIVANDATVKGGTYFPITIKKHVRAQLIAMKNHLPCIYLVDSGGIFLPYQAETFADKDHFGIRINYIFNFP